MQPTEAVTLFLSPVSLLLLALVVAMSPDWLCELPVPPPLPPDPPAPTPLVSSAQRCYNKKSALWCFVLPARSHNIVSTRRRGLNVWWLAWPRRSSLRTTAAKLHQVVSKIDTRKCIWLQLQSITDQEKKKASKAVEWTDDPPTSSLNSWPPCKQSSES